MAASIPTQEPTQVIAGDSWQWDIAYGDYPASDGWALAYAFRGPTDLDTGSGDVTVDADGWQVRIPATVTNLTAGPYRLIGYVTKGTERFTVYDAALLVLPNPVTAVNAQSHAERTLAVIDAAIEGRLTADIESYQIHGRSVSKIPMSELVKLRAIYASAVERERNPGQFGRSVEVHFVAP